MIYDEITDEKMWRFINDHLGDDPKSLVLKYSSKDLGFPLSAAVTQIECRRKSAAKLSDFNGMATFFYPTRLSSEQATNQFVARYHASLVEPGSRVADLTAGLGIDAMTITRRAVSVDAFELEEEKCRALRHNAEVMDCNNLTVHKPGDSIELLRTTKDTYEVIFIDPARRDDADRRTYALSDCVPDVKLELPLLTSRCKHLIIKASPMLDMTQTERDLPGLKKLSAVSLKGECKEILCIVEPGYEGPAQWSAVLINGDTVTEYTGSNRPEHPAVLDRLPSISDSTLYLYDPDAAVMKLGNRAALSVSFPALKRADTNTHLYLSHELYPDFPGRIFMVKTLVKAGDKSLRSLRGQKFNIVCRNFPMTPAQLKSRLKTIDGGTDFIYGIKTAGQNILAKCQSFKEKQL